MASGTEPSEQCLASSIGERCPHPQIHFRQGRGGARELRRGVEAHTGNVLSRTDTEQSGPRAPVVLMSFPAMSVTEARFWCSGRVRLLRFVWRKACVALFTREYALTSDYCINTVMHKPPFDISCMLPPGFPRRHPHATNWHHETLSESGQHVCVDGQFVHHAPNRRLTRRAGLVHVDPTHLPTDEHGCLLQITWLPYMLWVLRWLAPASWMTASACCNRTLACSLFFSGVVVVFSHALLSALRVVFGSTC